MKNCQHCGKQFVMLRHTKGFCSLGCSGAAKQGGMLTSDMVAGCTCCHAIIGFGGKKSAQLIGTTVTTVFNARKARDIETTLPASGSWKSTWGGGESYGGVKWDKAYQSEWIKDVKGHGKSRVFPTWGDHPEVGRWRSARQWARGSDYYRMKMRIRSRIYSGLKRNLKGPAKKVAKSEELIGCSYADYRNHIESTFTGGMNWGNWGIGAGKWNIDHIVPCSHFDLNDPGQQRAAFHWSNTEAMWSLLNISKGNRMSEAQPQLLLNK